MDQKTFWMKRKNWTIRDWYAEPEIPCPECDDFGIVVLDRNNQEREIKCHCRLRRQDILNAGKAMQYDHFPEKYLDANITQAEARLTQLSGKEYEYYAGAIDAIGAWLGNPSYNLILIGPVGTGKTYLAAATVNALKQYYNISPLWINTTGFVSEMAAMFSLRNGELEEMFKTISSVPVLVLDDLGRGGLESAAGVRSNIYTIINARYNAERPTIVTTNLLRKEMLEKFPEIADRLLEVHPHEYKTVLPVLGTSMRQTGGPK